MTYHIFNVIILNYIIFNLGGIIELQFPTQIERLRSSIHMCMCG